MAVQKSSKRRKILWVLVVLLAVNLFISLIFSQYTYPQTKIAGKDIGMVKRSKLHEKAESLDLISEKIPLVRNEKKFELSTDGTVMLNEDLLKNNEQNARHTLPIWNLLKPVNIKTEVAVDEKKLNQSKAKIEAFFKQAAQNATLSKDDEKFYINREKFKEDLIWENLPGSIVEQTREGKGEISVPVSTSEPAVTSADLEPDVNRLNEKLNLNLNVNLDGKTKNFDNKEIIKWYVLTYRNFEPSNYIIRNSIESFAAEQGNGVQNADQVVDDIKRAITTNERTDSIVVPAPLRQKKLSYCTNIKGVDANAKQQLDIKLEEVYKDPRGWSIGGRLKFEKVDKGCDFTVWLSAAKHMPSFGAVCDETWSCRIGNNVVINFDRWNNASEPWNKAGLAIQDYRNMVVMHETGHFFGLNHVPCPGGGQRAPVMQQQSINLDGCVFNPWALENEMDLVKKRYNLL